ncbi:hypothetical protein JNW88_20050, partial [Micromonospora sp. ATA32]|nr:hypothetical protein [Micromonospora sp. ATA32]
MRTALVTGLVGVLLGVFFATGVLGGGGESVVPASASTGAASTPTQPAAATSAP